MVRCYVCNKEVSPDKDISCDLCKEFTHAVCANLSRTEVQCLKGRDRRISFYCTSCTDMKLAIAKIHELKNTVDALQNEILELKANSGTTTPASAANDCNNLKNTETIIQEILERERRKQNLMLYNVPEQADLNRAQQITADTETVKEILTILNIPRDDIRPVRLDLNGCPMETCANYQLSPLIDVLVCKCIFGIYTILLVNIYIPPDIDLDDLEASFDALAVALLGKHVIFCGDFNIPKLLSNTDNDRKCLAFNAFMDILDLKQINNVTNCNGKILDLILTNLNCEIDVSHDTDPLVPEDLHHPALRIFVNMNGYQPTIRFPCSNIPHYDFYKTNYENLHKELVKIDWSFIQNSHNVNTALDEFYGKLYGALDKCVPKSGGQCVCIPPGLTAT
ncbi:endonuclease-reverse transcriptase [Holotrichia oblita]|uniref:Endonuclease-reverse transcriptase n=1 Tax=Holotrichia oblita TaxID=644536 RepID=A0ACB9TUW2_HOLOL|nr:endonuclease-reverse transcriptase [Holotrichia oblita]